MNFLMRALVRSMLKRSDAALIRASGGAPRTAGGRTMDPRFQFLEAQARKQPTPTELTAAMGRAQTDQMVYLFGGKREPGVRADAVQIPAGEGRTIPARLYHPVQRDPATPVFVFFHFGGGVVGNLETCDAFCTILANEIKGSVLSIEYRLAPEHKWPAGLDDAIAAYKWAVANAEKLGGPAGKAAVGGDSMGGNFTAILAQDMKRTGGPAPVVQLLIYPATDIASEHPSMTIYGDAFPLTRATMDWFMANYIPEGVDHKDLRLSPAYEKDLSGLPPALVYTAGFDPLVDQGNDYAQKLKAAGVRVQHHCFDSLNHGFTAFTGAIPAADKACRRIAEETAVMLRSLAPGAAR